MRLPVLILLDTSGSMSGVSLRRLQGAIERFKRKLEEYEYVRNRVEISIMGFNEHTYLICRWTKADGIKSTQLAAYGGTDLSRALDDAIVAISDWRQEKKEKGEAVLLLVSDGYGGALPETVKDRMSKGAIKLWFLGLPGYDRESASCITDEERIFELAGAIDDTCEVAFTAIAESIIATIRQTESVHERPMSDDVDYGLDRKVC